MPWSEEKDVKVLIALLYALNNDGAPKVTKDVLSKLAKVMESDGFTEDAIRQRIQKTLFRDYEAELKSGNQQPATATSAKAGSRKRKGAASTTTKSPSKRKKTAAVEVDGDGTVENATKVKVESTEASPSASGADKD